MTLTWRKSVDKAENNCSSEPFPLVKRRVTAILELFLIIFSSTMLSFPIQKHEDVYSAYTKMRELIPTSEYTMTCLRYIVSEIGDNIVDHSKGSGKIECSDNSERIYMTISDNGIGIPANFGVDDSKADAIIRKILSSPGNTTAEINHSGEGLYYSHQMVTKNGGNFTIKSSKDGTVIKFDISKNGKYPAKVFFPDFS